MSTDDKIFPITMPKWGIEMQKGTIAQWHFQPGQAVTKGAPLLEVETEKIVNSVEAPVSGVLRRIVADKGATENVGALIAVFAAANVLESEVDAYIHGHRPAGQNSDGSGVSAAPAAADGESRVSPIARRVAERLGVDIAKVKGTGHNGRVSKEDVEAYAAAAARPATVREKMTAMRAAIAKRLLESKQNIPHYRLAVDVDLSALLARRAELNAGAANVSINDLLVRASALALLRHPTVNAQLLGDEIVKYPHADIAIAVTTDGGLVTPIVRSADTKTSVEIGREIEALAARARSGRLTREDIDGGTFTISNLGMFGVDRFDAIINPPQVAILAVGAATDRVVARGGQPVVVKAATLTLSCDHRVVDGALGAQFLATLRELIEAPRDL